MKLTLKAKIIVAALAVLLIISATTAVILLMHHPKKAPSTATQAPPFSVLLPKGKTAASVGGQSITTPGGEKTYQFDDTIAGIPANISEQQLPASLSGANSSEEIRKFAEGFNATTIVTAGQTVVYVGTSAAGPQWGVFAQDNLLVIIKADHTIDKNDPYAKAAGKRGGSVLDGGI